VLQTIASCFGLCWCLSFGTKALSKRRAGLKRPLQAEKV